MVSPNVAIPVTVNDPPSSSDTLTPANVADLVQKLKNEAKVI